MLLPHPLSPPLHPPTQKLLLVTFWIWIRMTFNPKKHRKFIFTQSFKFLPLTSCVDLGQESFWCASLFVYRRGQRYLRLLGAVCVFFYRQRSVINNSQILSPIRSDFLHLERNISFSHLPCGWNRTFTPRDVFLDSHLSLCCLCQKRRTLNLMEPVSCCSF